MFRIKSYIHLHNLSLSAEIIAPATQGYQNSIFLSAANIVDFFKKLNAKYILNPGSCTYATIWEQDARGMLQLSFQPRMG